MCYHNNLYRENKGENKDPEEFGYFEASRRVRAIKLRGQKSEGFMSPLDALEWTGTDLSKLRPGQRVDTLEGKVICEKYITRATREAKAKAGGKQRRKIQQFNKVGNTEKFRYMANSIPKGALLTLSGKIHGTSGRTGQLLLSTEQPVQENALQRAWRWFMRRPLPTKVTKASTLVTGTRNTICCEGTEVPHVRPDGTEVPLGYRQLIHNSLEGCLRLGETVYYEIVALTDEGIPEFRHSVPADNIASKTRKKYGEAMYYRYGVEAGNYGVWIYRITMQNEQGDAVQLSWNQMTKRANELGWPVVPVLEQFVYNGDVDQLTLKLYELADGPSLLDGTHIREGVCVHVDAPTMLRTLKYKGFIFCHLEGIVKNNEDYVDPEEIA
jgi:hypothetical protein